jgi:signal peptidase II
MGGALGNVIDRVRQGYVVDFLNVEAFPVFNVADSCIVMGVGLLALEMLLEERRLARQKHQEQDTPQPTEHSETQMVSTE